jgi:hypothetical protein
VTVARCLDAPGREAALARAPMKPTMPKTMNLGALPKFIVFGIARSEVARRLAPG